MQEAKTDRCNAESRGTQSFTGRLQGSRRGASPLDSPGTAGGHGYSMIISRGGSDAVRADGKLNFIATTEPAGDGLVY